MKGDQNLFEWDEKKNRANFSKHGIWFDEAADIFSGPVLTKTYQTSDSGEFREVTIGAIRGVSVVCVAHTDRNGHIRIINARKATKAERKSYYACLEKTFS